MSCRSLPIALAIACPLLAAAPTLAGSVRPDHRALLSKPDRAEIVAPIALLAAARQSALDLTARTSSFVHPSAEQAEAWRQIYAARLGDFGDRFVREPRVGPDFVVATSVGNDAPDWESPNGQESVPAVPEPAGAIAFGLGGLLVGAALVRARRRADAARSLRG